MARLESASSSSSAEQARARAEAAAREREAKEKEEAAAEAKAKIREQTEQKRFSAESAHFRGKQSQSSFDHGEGKTRREHSTVRANRHGTTESTHRQQHLKSGAKTDFEETKHTSHGETHTRSKSTVTTAKGRSRSVEHHEKGEAEKGSHTEKSGTAKIKSSESQGSIGNKELVGGKTTLPGGVKAEGSVTGPGAAYDATASAGFSGGDLKVQVDVKVDAHLLAAQGSLEKDVKFKVGGQEFQVKLKLGANAEIGANGELKLDLDIGAHGAKVDASASGFAGAAGSLTGGLEVDEMKGGKAKELAEGSVTGTAIAGASGKAELNAGFHDGKFGFHAAVQGAIGVGAGLEFSGDVDVGNTLGALKDVAVGLGKQAVEDLGKSVVSASKELGHEVSDLNGYVNGLVDSGFSAAKNVISDGFNDVKKAVTDPVGTAKSLISHIPHPHIHIPGL